MLLKHPSEFEAQVSTNEYELTVIARVCCLVIKSVAPEYLYGLKHRYHNLLTKKHVRNSREMNPVQIFMAHLGNEAASMA